MKTNTSFEFWQQIYSSHDYKTWTNNNEFFKLFLQIMEKQQIQDRNYQEGISILLEKNSILYALLIYKENIYGIYAHNLAEIDQEILQKNLEEFRFGWLPNEVVLSQKGIGCILKDIPAEAEGFRPTFIYSQSNADILNGLGRKVEI